MSRPWSSHRAGCRPRTFAHLADRGADQVRTADQLRYAPAMSSGLDVLHTYFAGEKSAGLFCLALGVVSLALAFWLWRSGGSVRAMAIPIAIIGLGQVAIGIGLPARTPGQVARLERGFAENPERARADETARMTAVMRNFGVIKIVEAAVILLGVALALFARSRPWLVGVGLGLALQGVVMLAFDVFAEKRGDLYFAWLRGG